MDNQVKKQGYFILNPDRDFDSCCAPVPTLPCPEGQPRGITPTKNEIALGKKEQVSLGIAHDLQAGQIS